MASEQRKASEQIRERLENYLKPYVDNQLAYSSEEARLLLKGAYSECLELVEAQEREEQAQKATLVAELRKRANAAGDASRISYPGTYEYAQEVTYDLVADLLETGVTPPEATGGDRG